MSEGRVARTGAQRQAVYRERHAERVRERDRERKRRVRDEPVRDGVRDAEPVDDAQPVRDVPPEEVTG